MFHPLVLRKAVPDDRAAMYMIWERAVRATHTFLSEEDISFYSPLVRQTLELEMEFWVALEKKELLGFMALETEGSPVKVEALFIDPAHFGKGAGRALIEKAQRLYGRLILDVNEQNPGALAFYRQLGFRETGRSELDGTGRPFPLLHMKWKDLRRH